MKECIAKVSKNEPLGDGFYVLSLNLNNCRFGEILPGQFAMLGLTKSDGILLRRPFSVFDIDEKKKNVVFFYKVVGIGTKALAKLKKGEEVTLLMPLGKGFEYDTAHNKHVCIVTGGIGIAPFYLLMKRIKKYNPNKIHVFYGARSSKGLYFADFFKKETDSFHAATDDGSEGYKGFVSDLFNKKVKELKKTEKIADNGIVVYSCGPKPMMSKVARASEGMSMDCYVSMEELMGCGFGACFSCVIKESKVENYLTVCKDGPVFNSRNIKI